MAERRTIGAAMDMTPEKMAFIKGQADGAVPKKDSTTPPVRPALNKTTDLAGSPTTTEHTDENVNRPSRRLNKREIEVLPQAEEMLAQVLVAKTVRLPRRLVDALERASLEQRHKYARRHKQQEIVAEAVDAWLSKHGFLE